MVCRCADMSCRLPYLSTISIKLGADIKEGDLNRVLAQMQLHVLDVESLSLQIGTSWTDYTGTWAWLGSTTSLTKLQLTFAEEVSGIGWKHADCSQHCQRFCACMDSLSVQLPH
jgi:hypothetical protein